MGWVYRLAGRFPSVVIARRNISRAKVRSALAAASIVIGVVAIGAGGAAFKQSQLNNVRDQGATNVYLSPGIDKETNYFDREDLVAIEETVGGAGVVATTSAEREFVGAGRERRQVSLTYLDDPRRLYEIQQGAVPTNWRKSAVLSAAFADIHGLHPGDRLTLYEEGPNGTETDRSYRVVAVLAPTDAFGVDDVFLPIEATGTGQYDQVRITTGTVDEAGLAAERLRERFNQRKDRLLVFELTSLVRLFKSIVNGINVALAGLAAISLLVAGVSITNTMLMAVIKRREEIGVLRSVGYTKVDIVRILLVEALLLGVVGAVVGVAIAVGLTVVANAVFLGEPFAFSRTAITYLVGAAAFGVGTSLLAGVYPAWRAARQRPVEALRG